MHHWLRGMEVPAAEQPGSIDLAKCGDGLLRCLCPLFGFAFENKQQWCNASGNLRTFRAMRC